MTEEEIRPIAEKYVEEYCRCNDYTDADLVCAGIGTALIVSRKLDQENKQLKEQLAYAKSIIQSLLDNADEYARQRALDFLKE